MNSITPMENKTSNIIWFGKNGLTVGDEYLLGCEEGSPNTGDVKILRIGGKEVFEDEQME